MGFLSVRYQKKRKKRKRFFFIVLDWNDLRNEMGFFVLDSFSVGFLPFLLGKIVCLSIWRKPRVYETIAVKLRIS